MAPGQILGAQNAADPVRDPQVVGELRHLASSIEILGKDIENLNQRLCGVLRAEPPSATAEKSVSEVLVPVADQIKDARLSVQRLTRVVESMAQRLEV